MNIYLLLTGFEGSTVSYGPILSPSIYGPGAKRAGHKSKRKNRGAVTYRTDREDEVIKIFLISLLCVWRVRERFWFTRNVFKFLTHLQSKTSHFKVLNSLPRFNAKFRVKKKF